MNLQEQWQKTWKLLDASGDGGTMFRQLMDKYAEAHRRYHTSLHLAECFEHLNMLASRLVLALLAGSECAGKSETVH